MPVGRKRRMVARDEEEESADEIPQTQRRRQRAPVSDEASDEEESNTRNESPDADQTQDGGHSAIDQLVTKLVRYALACEYQRLPIRREAIREKVIGKHKGSFKQIFDGAQTQLRDKFGMEMVELPLKEKVTLKERRVAGAKASQSTPSSNAYVLRSTLPAAYRDPAIITPSVAPTAFLEASYTALYTTIVALILLNGGTLPDPKLDRYLRRMNADVNTPIDKTEATLNKMIKQGYLVKIKENIQGEETIDWVVGPRGKLEVRNKGVKALVQDVYGEAAPEDLVDRINSSLGIGAASDDHQPPPSLNAEAAVPSVEGGTQGRGQPPGRRRGEA